jgi:hypothetical protein
MRILNNYGDFTGSLIRILFRLTCALLRNWQLDANYFGDGAVTLKGLSQDGGWRIFLKTFAQDVSISAASSMDVHFVSLSTAAPVVLSY